MKALSPIVWCQQVSQWGLVQAHFCEVFFMVGIMSPTQLSTRFHQQLINHKKFAQALLSKNHNQWLEVDDIGFIMLHGFNEGPITHWDW